MVGAHGHGWKLPPVVTTIGTAQWPTALDVPPERAASWPEGWEPGCTLASPAVCTSFHQWIMEWLAGCHKFDSLSRDSSNPLFVVKREGN